MGKITIDELSNELKEYMNGLGLTEEQVNQLVENFSGDKSQLQTTAKNSLVDAINEVFQSGNSAKQNLVAALVAKGLEATSDQTFTELIDSINNIPLAQGNAVEADVLSGKTFTNADGVLRTGKMTGARKVKASDNVLISIEAPYTSSLNITLPLNMIGSVKVKFSGKGASSTNSSNYTTIYHKKKRYCYTRRIC